MHSKTMAAVSISLFAGACTKVPATTAGAEANLRAALATYDSAWQAKDAATVARLLAPGYTYFTSNGGLNDKAGTLGFLSDTSYALSLSRRTEVRVTMEPQVATVSSRWEGEGRYRGEVVLDDQTCGQTWILRDGDWLLFVEHCVNRAPAATEGT